MVNFAIFLCAVFFSPIGADLTQFATYNIDINQCIAPANTYLEMANVIYGQTMKCINEKYNAFAKITNITPYDGETPARVSVLRRRLGQITGPFESQDDFDDSYRWIMINGKFLNLLRINDLSLGELPINFEITLNNCQFKERASLWTFYKTLAIQVYSCVEETFETSFKNGVINQKLIESIRSSCRNGIEIVNAQ